MGCQNLFRVWDDRRNSMKSISHSQFSAYNECNLKWKLRYIDKLSKFSGSIHTVFGTAMHTTIQAYLTEFYNKSIKSADSMDLVTMLKEEMIKEFTQIREQHKVCLLYTSPSPRDRG